MQPCHIRLSRPIGQSTSYKGLSAGTKYKVQRDGFIPEIRTLRSIAYFRNFPFCLVLLRDLLLVYSLTKSELTAVIIKGYPKNYSESLFKIFLVQDATYSSAHSRSDLESTCQRLAAGIVHSLLTSMPRLTT
jgi:hypothetical protein